MFDDFKKNVKVETVAVIENEDLISNINNDLKTLFFECGGCSFNNGLYRIHNPNSSLHWAIIIGNYYPKYKGRIIPFAYDWMGRHFTTDVNRENCILMFDPATGEDFELNENLLLFHNESLVYERESVLAEQLFNKVINVLSVSKINYNDCIGYKVPLFLGGSDTLNNYELSNMEVYWEIQCQLYLQIKDLPPGTKIDSIKFKR